MAFSGCGELTGESTGANDILGADKIGGISFVELEGGKKLLEGTMKDGGKITP
jgi:hypothetical protein